MRSEGKKRALGRRQLPSRDGADAPNAAPQRGCFPCCSGGQQLVVFVNRFCLQKEPGAFAGPPRRGFKIPTPFKISVSGFTHPPTCFRVSGFPTHPLFLGFQGARKGQPATGRELAKGREPVKGRSPRRAGSP